MVAYQFAYGAGIDDDLIGDEIGECGGEAAVATRVAVQTALGDKGYRCCTKNSAERGEEISLHL